MSRSRLRSIIFFLFSLGLISVIIYYLNANSDAYLSLLQLSPLPVSLIFTITLASPLINGAINTLLFQNLGANLSYREGILLAAVSSLANQLPISGGIVSKGLYLKKKHELAYSKFASATLALFALFIAINGLIGLIILTSWILMEIKEVMPLLFLSFSIMASIFLVFLVPITWLYKIRGFRSRLRQAIDGWTPISNNPVLVIKLIGLQTSLMLLLAFRFWLAFRMLSQEIRPDEVILFSSASILTQLVSLAPGGLGVREAIVGAVAAALGFDMGVSVLAVGLDRLISTLAILLTGSVSAIIIGKKYTNSSQMSRNQT